MATSPVRTPRGSPLLGSIEYDSPNHFSPTKTPTDGEWYAKDLDQPNLSLSHTSSAHPPGDERQLPPTCHSIGKRGL